MLAKDSMYCCSAEEIQRFLRERLAKQLGTYEFQSGAFPLLKFAHLLDVILRHSVNYSLADTMCYWYCWHDYRDCKGEVWVLRAARASPRGRNVPDYRANKQEQMEDGS